MRPLTLASVVALHFMTASWVDDQPAQATASAPIAKPDSPGEGPKESIAQQYLQILTEFESEQVARRQARAQGQSAPTKPVTAANAPRDLIVQFARRMVNLAQTSPAEPAARDALLWAIDQPGRGDLGPYGDEFIRAAALLVRHHGNDPDAVRVGLRLDNVVTPGRDVLLFGFYAAARGREAQGLARLSLAQYLVLKAKEVEYARGVVGRPKQRAISGGKVISEIDLPDDFYAYHLSLRQCDPQIIRAEAERLFEEVISQYGDVPHVTRRQRVLEALLKEPAPKWNGQPLKDEGRRSIERLLAQKKTLGEEATARLDDMSSLAVGKSAPEIEGLDFDGKPLKLSDFKGKIVVLVFWGTWCGPCMAQVPQERALVERLKDRPFALLGVDCEPDKDQARAVIARERMTWPNWFDGPAGEGPIARRYHIRGYPSVFFIDAKGIIRSRGGTFDQVDKLLEEINQDTSRPPASRPARP